MLAFSFSSCAWLYKQLPPLQAPCLAWRDAVMQAFNRRVELWGPGWTGISVFGVLPVAMLVKSPEVLALVSQASVGFVFFFATVMAVLAFSPVDHAGRIPHLAIWGSIKSGGQSIWRPINLHQLLTTDFEL